MNKPLHILQVCGRLPYPPLDGGAIGIYNITRSLARRGHRITMATFGTDESRAERMRELCDVHLVHHDTSTRSRKIVLNLFSRFPVTMQKYQTPKMNALLESLCREARYDVVHVDHIHMSPYGALLQEQFGLPYVLREHNFETILHERFADAHQPPLLHAYLAMQARRLRRFETEQLAFPDVCAAITDEDAGRISEVSNVRVRVIPAGVDLEEFSPLDPNREEAAHVTIIGSLRWQPNLDAVRWFLDNIWPLFKAQESRAELSIVGESPPAWLKERKDPSIHIHGFVEDLRDLISRSTILVVPLRIGGGMRIKLLEYFALGKAVVATPVGAEGNRGKDDVHLMIREDPASFAAAMLTLVQQPEKRRQLGASARALVEQEYSWDVVAQQFEEAYNEAIAVRRGRTA